MPTTDDDPRSTGSMSAVELAEADGQVMGRALAGRPEAERAAWWRGIRSVLEPGADSGYRGLPRPPEGCLWATSYEHVLRGSVGLAHIIPVPAAGMQALTSGAIEASCGLAPTAWITVGRWENERREACPQCAGQKVIS